MRDDLVTILFSIAKTDVTTSRQITEPSPVHPVPLTKNASSFLRYAHSSRAIFNVFPSNSSHNFISISFEKHNNILNRVARFD